MPMAAVSKIYPVCLVLQSEYKSGMLIAAIQFAKIDKKIAQCVTVLRLNGFCCCQGNNVEPNVVLVYFLVHQIL